MKKWIKVVLQVIALALIVMVPGISAKAGIVKKVYAEVMGEEEKFVAIHGEIESDVLAVAATVYDSEGNLIKMHTSGTDGKGFWIESPLSLYSKGKYTIKVADYNGGSYSTATIEITEEILNPDDGKDDGSNKDDGTNKPADTNKGDGSTTPVKVVIVSNNDIATTVSGTVLKSDMKIQQKEFAKTSDTYKNAVKAIEKNGVKALKEAEYIRVYEIKLLQDNVEIHEVGGVVEVSFNAPSDLKVTKDEKVVVYRLNDDGSLTKCNTKFENGKIVFETDHFSIYILAKEKVNTVAAENIKTAPETGDNNKLAFWLYVFIAGGFITFVAIFRVVKFSRRR